MKRVLIVFAEDAMQHQLVEFFRRRQQSVAVLDDAEEACAVLRDEVSTFVLIDFEGDEDRALGLCREIRGLPRRQESFVLALPRDSSEAIRAALEAGADDCLLRPLNLAALQLRLAIGHRFLATQRQSAKAIETGQRRLRTLLETMGEGYFEVDQRGLIELANSRLSRLVGFTNSELIGSSADEILVAPSVRERLPGQTLLGFGTGSEQYTIPLTTKSGEPIWVKLTAAPRPSTDGGTDGSLGVVQDITEQRNAEESLRFREEFFRVLSENASDLISTVDLDGRILYQSLSSERLLGRPADDMVGRGFFELVHEDDRERFESTLQQTLQDVGASESIQLRLRHHDGHWCYVESLCNNLIDDPVVGGIVVTSRDITERRRVEADLKRERALFQQLFHNSPAGIVILDDDDRVADVNRSFVDLFQYEVAEMRGRRLSDLIVPEQLRDEATQLSKSVFARHIVDHETVRRRKDEVEVDVAVLGYPIELAEGRTGAFGLYTDITERKRAERKLFHDAFHDALTGLPNRSLLTERVERDLRRAVRRHDYRFALLFIDLDRFKQINDTLGHAAGDQVLIETAQRLQSCVRPGDTVARLAGDEFTVILEDVKEVADATHIADRILDSLRQPIEVGGQTAHTSGSIGIAFSSRNYKEAEDLIRDADVAMYRAKRRGKSCYEIADREMQRHSEKRLELESLVAEAVKREEQVLHYQPIISLATGRIESFEALVRWRDADGGLLGPEELIPICEQTGIIIPLGLWVLRRACEQVAEWERRFPDHDCARVSVNVSSKQLAHPDFLAELDAICAQTGVEPAAISLELRESVMAEATESMALLWQIRKRGYTIQIDDFGNGSTSLRELARSPVDTLKVDRCFVARMKPDGENGEIVRAAAALGASLGLKVVAEGVETPRHLEQVRELGLSAAQGFLFSRSLPADAATTVIAARPRW